MPDILNTNINGNFTDWTDHHHPSLVHRSILLILLPRLYRSIIRQDDRSYGFFVVLYRCLRRLGDYSWSCFIAGFLGSRLGAHAFFNHRTKTSYCWNSLLHPDCDQFSISRISSYLGYLHYFIVIPELA